MRFSPMTERLAGTGSDKWAIHLAARQMKAKGQPVIELTIGEPDMPPDPQLIAVAHQAMLAGRVGYSDGRGEPELTKAIAARYARRRAGVTPRNVLCFPGTQTALFATLLGVVTTGDGVLLGDPCYATYEGLIRASGAHMVPVPLYAEKGFHMQAADLEAAITPACRAILLNSPHNPTGAVLSAREIAEIGEVARAHDLWILSDEVYEQLIFSGDFASPFDLPELAERVVALASISKSHAAPGFRSGWAVGSEEFCDRLLPICEAMLFGNQPFIADMTAFALTHPLDTAARMRQNYLVRARLIVERLSVVSGLRPLMPEAGMFALVDVTATGMDGKEFATRLLHEQQVAVMPGSSFGERAKGFVRLSLTVPEADIAAACERIAAFVQGGCR